MQTRLTGEHEINMKAELNLHYRHDTLNMGGSGTKPKNGKSQSTEELSEPENQKTKP